MSLNKSGKSVILTGLTFQHKAVLITNTDAATQGTSQNLNTYINVKLVQDEKRQGCRVSC